MEKQKLDGRGKQENKYCKLRIVHDETLKCVKLRGTKNTLRCHKEAILEI
jgi:hypothetical protein